MNGDNTPLGPGAEFDAVRAMLTRWGTLAHGLGDDAALLDVPAGQRLVVSTDSSVENVHFKGVWFTPQEIAYRAAASALSDLAAMGAAPLGMVIALTLTDGWRLQLAQLADGFAAASRDNSTPIVGGDLTSGSELSISVTVLGAAARPVARSGAKPGDTVWVTGKLGGPLLALRALEHGVAPQAEQRARFAHPVPRLREGQWFGAHGATALIDISDGIAGDASHIAAASGVKIVLDLDRLPLVHGATPTNGAQSGEEYELLVTAPGPLDARQFEDEFGISLTAVGRVESAIGQTPTVEAQSGGVRVPLPGGHSHFSG